MSIIIPRVSHFTIQNIDLLVLVLNTVITCSFPERWVHALVHALPFVVACFFFDV
jgi:hypothetical protein